MTRIKTLGGAFWGLLLAGLLVGSGRPAQAQPSAVPSPYRQTGKASYYADRFQGRQTASGETFDMHDYTAAHPTLPFQTLVRVTNPANGRAVVVRINDRGPYSHRRIIDLSKQAALELGMIGQGATTVAIETVGQAEVPAPALAGVTFSPDTIAPVPLSRFVVGNSYDLEGRVRYPKGYGVQVSAYGDLENALADAHAVVREGAQDVYIQAVRAQGKATFRVLVGTFAAPDQATYLVGFLAQVGFEGFVKKHLSAD